MDPKITSILLVGCWLLARVARRVPQLPRLGAAIYETSTGHLYRLSGLNESRDTHKLIPQVQQIIVLIGFAHAILRVMVRIVMVLG
jgi:hypothetical protein